MTERADVLIIGAGASGGVAARRLAEAGYRVVCLEQGEWTDPGAYRGAEADWELAARKQWSSAPSLRRTWADYPIDFSESEMGTGNFNGVGGGTVLYNAVWPRLAPSDFRGGSIDGASEDWPITYEELQPYYERTDRDFGVSGLGGNPAYPPGADPPLPPLPIGRAGLLLARAHARLGWHWWPEYNAIASAPYEGRRPCVQRGTCPSGCGEGAKASTDVTHFPRAIAMGALVITGARVRRLPTDKKGLVTGAEWIDANGVEHFQPADVVLCAANGIGTPRILLLSASPKFPEGLANSSGLVGRRLMMHPCVRVTGYFDDDLESWQGHFGGAIQCLQFYGTAAGRDFVRGAKWSLAPTGGPVNTALPRTTPPVFGADHHQYMRDRFGRGAAWIMLCEDLPDEHNRVELSTTMTDASGLPAAKIIYRVNDNTERIKAWNFERAIESMNEAGAWMVETADFASNSHQMGTCRMGDDPSSSVVDRWGVTHDVPNLGIIDGSVFVTAGAVNPTSTIAALALRAVEHLLARRHDVRTPESPSMVVVPSRPRPPASDPPMVAAPDALSSGERSSLARVADVLLPAGYGMPAATEVGIADGLIDWVLKVRPDLANPVRHALLDVGPDPGAGLERLRAEHPSRYEALTLALVAGYYHHDGVRHLLRYPGQVAKPVRTLDYPEYLTEGLLDHLLSESESESDKGGTTSLR